MAWPLRNMSVLISWEEPPLRDGDSLQSLQIALLLRDLDVLGFRLNFPVGKG